MRIEVCDWRTCAYCGLGSESTDHLIPMPMSGEALRPYVPEVPACLECNSFLGDRYGYRLDVRREAVRARLRAQNSGLLNSPRWTAEELAEFEGQTRQRNEARQFLRSDLESRLDFEYSNEVEVCNAIEDAMVSYRRLSERKMFAAPLDRQDDRERTDSAAP